jgi:hypothetical protein
MTQLMTQSPSQSQQRLLLSRKAAYKVYALDFLSIFQAIEKHKLGKMTRFEVHGEQGQLDIVVYGLGKDGNYRLSCTMQATMLFNSIQHGVNIIYVGTNAEEQLSRLSPDGFLEVSLLSAGEGEQTVYRLHIASSTGYSFELSAHKAEKEEFPTLGGWQLPSSFSHEIDNLLRTVSSDRFRVFSHIKFDLEDPSKLVAVSSDSFRLYRSEIPITMDNEFRDDRKLEVLVPAQILSMLQRIAKKCEIQLYVSEYRKETRHFEAIFNLYPVDMVSFQWEPDCNLRYKLTYYHPDMVYMRLDKLLNLDPVLRIKVVRQSLLSRLQENKELLQIVEANTVKLNLEEFNLHLCAIDDKRRPVWSMKTPYWLLDTQFHLEHGLFWQDAKHVVPSVVVNLHFLIDALLQLNEAEVEIIYQGSRSPLVLQTSSQQVLIMPLTLK